MQKVYKYLPKSGLVCYNCQLQLMMNWNTGTAELGGAGPPHFLPQTQFLTAFLGHRVNKSCKVTRTVTKI